MFDSAPDVPILPGLAALADRYDAFIVDLWGVLHDGVRPYPGAIEALRELKRHDKRVAILSNAPRRAADVARRTAEIGVTPDLYDHLLSSGEETWRSLKERADPRTAALGRAVFPLMARRDRFMLDGLDLAVATRIAEAGFILATGVEGPGDRVADFEATLAAGVARGLPMVCANPDLEVVRDGVREICAGALAARYEALGGEVRYHGKPHPSIYRACFAALGVADRRRIVAVGDSLRTDIAGAERAGIDSVLVTGGLHAEELGVAAGGAPGPRALAAACARAGHLPTAAVPAFAW